MASAAGSNHPASLAAVHHAPLLPRKPPVPADRAQTGRGSQERSVLNIPTRWRHYTLMRAKGLKV